ncbi:MAG: UMP kinase [Nanoarchaeota archaeon]|nr:UMP kinase [Nanoarchaeota archaeon]
MKKHVVVLSLGGSMIIPKDINVRFLQEFKKVLLQNTKKFKFVVVCGGGSTARKYISGLEKQDLPKKTFFQGLLGIASTRLNARFMTYFFNEDANKGIPHDMKEVKNLLAKYDVVFCGALRYAKKETSDGTSAKLANFFKSEFINMTNVKGIFTKNPAKFKDAKFIPEISWKNFHKLATKETFKPGQHFVLDQSAAKIIKKYKIPTYIIGNYPKQIENIILGKEFVGSKIEG